MTGPSSGEPLGAGAVSRKKLAAATTVYHVRSHADNYITRFLEGYWINEKFHDPVFNVAAVYLDRRHRADICERLSMAYGFQAAPTIADALTLGTGKLAVDGVLLIVEHGDYPVNEKNQRLLPRYEFMRQVVQVFRESGRSVPVFVDKQLSHDWAQAQQMYDWSRELGFPMLAGSTVPVAFRRPELDIPLDSELEEILAVSGGHRGDGWLFHTVEALQCFAERRRGGETGVRAVQTVIGAGVWQAAREGRWDRGLLDAALECRSLGGTPGRPEEISRQPLAGFIEYNDGLKGTVLALGGGLVFEHLVAFRLKGRREPLATLCYLPTEHADHTSPVVDAISRMILTGKLAYPIERNLLTTGILSFIMESGYQGQKRLETPMLNITYRAPEVSYFARGAGL